MDHRLRFAIILLLLARPSGARAQSYPSAPDTQNPADKALTPAEALAGLRLPPGFQATLFAAEPDVRQPIAMAFDDRGRLWVVECFSYPEWKAPDRVLVFTDKDNDGRFDERKVFLEGGRNLTGIELGFGGVWLCSAPELLFVPDRDGDDVPDGPGQVLLDGWNYKEGHHNVFNGLTWGPDGWLYGGQGILAESNIGRPGTPDDQRVRMNCGIWRYHPVTKAFEVVAHGTTNPWGLDFNDVGEAFFANCVIGHLWHLIPGARYARMFGRDFNPYAFQLIEATSDHLHWGGGHWTESRGGAGRHDVAGGGHAHCGAMVYLGDNWPEQYRGTFFTVNIHGRRLNNDHLERKGSGYVGRHAPDFGAWGDPWFRGVAVKYGPDGGVYVADWSDLGECHDADGVHRSSGRIYKITYGTPKPPTIADVSKLSPRELAALQADGNEWYARHARRRLQELASTGGGNDPAEHALMELLTKGQNVHQRLRALWALCVMGLGSNELIEDMLRDADENVRAWGLRLQFDPARRPFRSALTRVPRPVLLQELARRESSPVVRLAIASALQRLEPERRWETIEALLSHTEDADDHNLPLMIWYATEPLVMLDPPRALELASHSRIPRVTRFIFRRAASEPAGMDHVLQALAAVQTDEVRLLTLQEMGEALAGQADVRMPGRWPEVLAGLLAGRQQEVLREAESLSVRFGDRAILPRLRQILMNAQAPIPERQRALELLVQAGDTELTGLLPTFMNKLPDLREPAIRAMARFNDARTPGVIVGGYRGLTAPERQTAIATLSSRPAFAQALLDALERGVVAQPDISAYHVRQMLALGDPAVKARIEKLWGAIRETPQDKAKAMADYAKMLSPAYLKSADLSRGRVIFDRICAACHTLFGEGGRIGPDLTGSNRADLGYILENVCDPSAIVGREHQISIFELRDGRILVGLVRHETDSAVTVQTQTEQVVLPRSELRSRRTSELSMMPEELFAGLRNDEIRDLVAYLASPRQVPRPAEGIDPESR